MQIRNEAAAIAVAIRLHRDMNMIAEQSHLHMRCSVGVVILPPGNRMIDRELRIADDLMYESKQRGAGLTVATAHDHNGIPAIVLHEISGEEYRVPATLAPVAFTMGNVAIEEGFDAASIAVAAA